MNWITIQFTWNLFVSYTYDKQTQNSTQFAHKNLEHSSWISNTVQKEENAVFFVIFLLFKWFYNGFLCICFFVSFCALWFCRFIECKLRSKKKTRLWCLIINLFVCVFCSAYTSADLIAVRFAFVVTLNIEF